MKKILLSVSLALTICLPTFALDKNDKQVSTIKNANKSPVSVNTNPVYAIGYIDIDKILAKYKKYQDIQANQKVALAEINEYTANAQKEVNAGSTPEEKKQLADKYTKEIQNKKDAFKAKYAPQVEALKNNIKVAIKTVANKKKLFAVFKNDTMYFGGTDITNEVIAELNKV